MNITMIMMMLGKGRNCSHFRHDDEDVDHVEIYSLMYATKKMMIMLGRERISKADLAGASRRDARVFESCSPPKLSSVQRAFRVHVRVHRWRVCERASANHVSALEMNMLASTWLYE